MTKCLTFPNLEGLADLACRDAVDIRPTLLRVLTDLYIQKPSHTIDEEHHYAELALRLIDVVGPAIRTAISVKLATYPQAPRAVLERLAQEGDDMTGTPSVHGSRLTAIDFRVMIDRLAPVTTGSRAMHHENSASASPLDDDTHPDDAHRPVTQAAGHSDAHSDPSQQETPTANELTALFFDADSMERELILQAVEFLSVEPAEDAHATASPDVLRRLEISALAHQRQILLRELGQALGLSRSLVERIVDDRFGEPILVAAKALGMRADMLQRILLFLNPTVGHSVRRVYDLSKLYDEIATGSASVLVRIWRAADAGDDPPAAAVPPHRPLAQLRPAAAQQTRPQAMETERRIIEG